jgi:hypothetical protein
MFSIYTAPTAVFTRLREKPTWVIPLIIALVATLAITALSIQYVDWSGQREKMLEQFEERGMTEEQQEQALERMESFTDNPLMRYGFPLLGAIITQLVAFFFLALVYNLSLPLLGATGNFTRVMSVTAWAGLVMVPAVVVRAILTIMSKSAEVSTSLLLVAPNVSNGFLKVVLSRVDLFTIWQLVLVAIGLKVMFDIKGSKSYWLVAAVWALITGIFALIASFTGR